MELVDTIKNMLSDDYLTRLRAEFDQTRIRYDKLVHILEVHKQSLEKMGNYSILVSQKIVMQEYLSILRYRLDKECYYDNRKY